MLYVIYNHGPDGRSFCFVEAVTLGAGRVLAAAVDLLNARGYQGQQRIAMRGDVVVSDEFRNEILGVLDYIRTFVLRPLSGHEEAHRAALLRLHIEMRLESWDIPDWFPVLEGGA